MNKKTMPLLKALSFMPFLNRFRTRGNELTRKKAILLNCIIQIRGVGNTIVIGNNSLLYKSKIYINGDNNKVIIGDNCVVKHMNINVSEDYNSIEIGDDNHFCGSINVASMEGNTILIGSHCLFSADIEIRNGDSHSIYNESGRINNSKSIIIGDKVWVGQRAMILKGSKIGHNSVVGCASIVTKEFNEENCVIAGCPARIIKNNIYWKAERE